MARGEPADVLAFHEEFKGQFRSHEVPVAWPTSAVALRPLAIAIAAAAANAAAAACVRRAHPLSL